MVPLAGGVFATFRRKLQTSCFLFLLRKQRLTLSSDEELLLHLVAVRIPEVGHGKGSATAWVVDDLLDDSLDVSMPAK